MKSRFSTIDITAVIRELLRFISMRVMNVYDVDNKTYLIRLGKPDDKAVILMESGIKLHSTEFDWPKNPAPSGFSMKMRKHLKGRRLESVQQLGVDRIVDLTFGSGEAAYHVILELYDRGNIVLTDFEYTILNILRPRTDTEDVRFAVREKYPVTLAKAHEIPSEERIREIILSGKDGDMLKKLLIPHLDYGPAMIEHCLQVAGLPENVKIGKGFTISQDMQKLLVAIEEAESLLQLFQTQNSKGYIIQKSEKRPNAKEGEPTELLTYDEFHPFLFRQHEKRQYEEFDSFNKSVDQFYSQQESQKLELKTLQQERSALKKLDNIKKDHEKRVVGLQKEQEVDKIKGQLIEMNLPLVDSAIKMVLTAVANQIDWTEIRTLVKEAQLMGDPVATSIKDLNLATNHITLLLQDPYVDSDFEDDQEDIIPPMKVELDLGLTAYSNSRKYFEKKKTAAVKEQKTMDASSKALKSAERKTKETLKEVATAASINKARKTFWFEKFLWFISSENFLVVGGRDQQQNELLVKRYMKQGDIYVHADLHGASSVVIKNHTGEPVPPKTLNEAGTMAICNSAAWDAKVVTSAWWVFPHQVSKTAPSGEYLTTGSFMIRGKKNYLPPSYLVYGFGFLFKLEESSVARHEGERKVRTAEDDEISVVDSVSTEAEIVMETDSEEEEEEQDSDSTEGKEGGAKLELSKVKEESVEDVDAEMDSVNEVDSCDNARDVQELGPAQGEVKVEEGVVRTVEEGVKREEMKAAKSSSGKKFRVEKQCSSVPPKIEFPNTEINVELVPGDKYQLSQSLSTHDDDSEPVIHLGDNVPVVFGEKKAQSGSKLSAKQRREMKKAKKIQSVQDGGEDEEEDAVSWLADSNQGRRNKETRVNKQQEQQHQQEQQQQQPQSKRGQKGKMKKIKEKYKDQDDEERQLRMEILNSAGSKKEDKKKKGKKVEEKIPQTAPPKKKKPELVDIIIQDVDTLAVQDDKAGNVKGEVEEEEKQEEDTHVTTADVQLLNSLTGIPVTEDELLFAVPVCAPYNALINYKYKVKLLPGSTKRGKAAKIALNTHLQDKNMMPREKDLLKILKDADMSRNIPGKVKVTAPHLHKGKKK